MSQPADVIHTEEYGDLEIYSQNSMEYFWQDKQPVCDEDYQEFLKHYKVQVY